MLGAGVRFGRGRGEDRFYDSSRARKGLLCRQNDRLCRPQEDATATPSCAVKDVSVQYSITGAGDRVVSDEATKSVAISNPQPVVSPLSNLERFLQSVTPSVPAQFLSKSALRGWKTSDLERHAYFVLGDLWETFKEWSAYGAGVPLLLNNTDCVVQYYVPYLSGIQLYGMESSTKPRQWGEETDSDYRDSSSDGSSDSETKRRIKHSREPPHHNDPSITAPLRMDRLSLRDQHLGLLEDCSSDEAESCNSQGCLLFEYLERDLPYLREPLADKISDLASRFPQLKTLRSCDLLPCSWISVAWYPIYRIPTGQTLKDLDACFLTYHSLHTAMGGPQSPRLPFVAYPCQTDAKKVPLRIFGLASYKFKGSSLWMRNGGVEHQLANKLSMEADKWLRELQVNHPDFIFFSRRDLAPY